MDPIDNLLKELIESTAMPSQASLYHLSNLDAESAARVREVWMDLPVDLRRRLVTRLVGLAEADFEVNFGEVFRLGLTDGDAEVRTAAVEGLWEAGDGKADGVHVEELAGAPGVDEACEGGA